MASISAYNQSQTAEAGDEGTLMSAKCALHLTPIRICLQKNGPHIVWWCTSPNSFIEPIQQIFPIFISYLYVEHLSPNAILLDWEVAALAWVFPDRCVSFGISTKFKIMKMGIWFGPMSTEWNQHSTYKDIRYMGIITINALSPHLLNSWTIPFLFQLHWIQ